MTLRAPGFRPSTLAAIVAPLLLIAPFGEASAQTKSPAESENDRATRLYQKGKAAFLEKRWADAEAAYLEAWKLAHTFDVAANLAQTEMRLNKYREAAHFAAYSLRNAPPSSKPEQREATRALLDEAKAKVGTLRLKLNVPEATVLIDGATIPPEDARFDLFVEPGAHTIVARRDGYEETRSTVQARAGSSHEVSLSLKAIPVEVRPMWPTYVMGGVGGAAAIAGGVLLGVWSSKLSSVKDLNTSIKGGGGSCVSGAANFDARCATLESDSKSADLLGRAGVGLLVVGGASAAGALIYFLVPKSTVRVSPAGAGLQITGAL